MSSRDLHELQALDAPLVVYVGGVLTRAAGLPDLAQLARLLLEVLPPDTSTRRRAELRALVERGRLADAFTEFERELSFARLGLEVERALDERSLPLPELATALAALGGRIHGVITPNLDRLLERAFEAALVSSSTPRMSMAQRGGWLLKVNGSVHEPASWVLTREQRARVSWREPLYARVLESLFVARHMLFVGVELEDPLFAGLIDELRGLARGAPPRHWALVPRAKFDGPARISLAEAGISAIPYDSSAQLLEQLRSLAPPRATGEAPRAPAASLPSVPRGLASDGPVRILFASALPRAMERLALDREQRVVQHALERAVHRERFELTTLVATSFADLSNALLEVDYDLVHIACHGEELGLILDLGGRRAPVPPEQLMALFDESALPAGRLRCVVLNSCWSSAAAQLPTRVPTRIAMNGEIDDGAALAFSEGFYAALGAGRDFARAYREGQRRAAIAAPAYPLDVGLFEG